MKLRPEPNLRTSDKLRFWDKVQKGDPEACWIWTAGQSDDGYGLFQIKRTAHRAHRIAYFIQTGVWPGEYHVRHQCHNRQCVNASHMLLGDNQDNVDDKVRAGRQSRVKGEQHGQAKLTTKDVKRLKRLLKSKKIKPRELAEMFHISQRQIIRIKTGECWS